MICWGGRRHDQGPPFGANMANNFMRLEEGLADSLKANRFHVYSCGKPYESSLNSRNGKSENMDISNFITCLRDIESRNNSLEFMESIVLDHDERIVDALNTILASPSTINNTNRFASLLVEYCSDKYIETLVKIISNSKLGNSPWLADYMYALGCVLEESDEYFEATDEFVHLLGDWLLSTGGGEISWKASYILAEIKNCATLPYLLSGARDKGLFHQARIACIRGIVNHYRDQAKQLLETLVEDSRCEVKEAAESALAWLKNA